MLLCDDFLEAEEYLATIVALFQPSISVHVAYLSIRSVCSYVDGASRYWIVVSL